MYIIHRPNYKIKGYEFKIDYQIRVNGFIFKGWEEFHLLTWI